jgi:hypothetical protein
VTFWPQRSDEVPCVESRELTFIGRKPRTSTLLRSCRLIDFGRIDLNLILRLIHCRSIVATVHPHLHVAHLCSLLTKVGLHDNMQAPSTSLLRAFLKPSSCCAHQIRQASNKSPPSKYVDPKKYHKINALDKLHRRQKEAVRQESQSNEPQVTDPELITFQSAPHSNVPIPWSLRSFQIPPL